MNKIMKSLLAFLLVGLSMTITVADDTDIINAEIPVDTNILFVMDMSGSMEWGFTDYIIPADPNDSRKGILHSALKTVLTDPTLANINMGIASFSGDSSSNAHGISYPISPIDADAATILDSNPLFTHQGTSYLPVAGLRSTRGYIGDVIPTTWTAKGETPIVDALYEAALYFRGDAPYWGRKDPSDVRSAHPSTYTGLLTDVTTSTTTNVCKRKACVGAACVNDVQCGSTPHTTTCSTPACLTAQQADGAICTGPTTGRTTCGKNVTNCGNGNNCQTEVVTKATCNLASPSACYASDSNYSNCTLHTNNNCTTSCPDGMRNEDGSCVNPVQSCNPTTYYSCDVSRTRCDVDKYSCTNNVQSCTQEVCSDVTTTSTNLVGNATYNSPITEECANNGIILLSDGEATVNGSAGLASTLMGAAYSNNCDSGSDFGRCGKELTKFLASQDNSASVAGDQFVNTHAIGLALTNHAAEDYLEGLATNGGGHYVNASSPADLVAALKNTILSVARARSFSSPTYTASATSMMSHGNNVYVPVFDKGVGSQWSGNLKKYTRQNATLKDADGDDATDQFGGLKDTARDLWSSDPSINSVKSGGVANKLPTADSRLLFTDAGMAGSTTIVDNLKISNSNVSKALLGNSGMADAHRDELINFIRGKKSDGTARHHMGDIIHSKPVVLSYNTGTTAVPVNKTLLFIGTNEGYLHAVDESTGVEQFAFMPSLLLKNIDAQFKNDAITPHPYGVDGLITLLHNDVNNNGKVDGAEKAYLFFGLRRGGKAYYAVDVTNPSSPSLMWKIDNTVTGFNDLGYSWSQPTVSHMRDATNKLVPVLVFGGGYIDDNGLEGPVQTDNGTTVTGSDVYIINALTGSLLWKTPSNAINYAVPGSIRTLDITRNGSLDRLYFGDTGGNIWRIDFLSNKISDLTNSAKQNIQHFADLGGAAPKRKFFTEPDVAIFKDSGKYLISVAIGSGERPKPLDASTDDHFFVMFDQNVLNIKNTTPAVVHPTITVSDLKDATSAAVSSVLVGGKKGWYMDLQEITGEKVLSRATTYNNKIIFSTFGTTSLTVDACAVSNVNQTRLYVVDLMTAGNVLDLDESGTVTTGLADRSKKIATGEIPGPSQIIFNSLQATSGGSCTVNDCVRPEEISIGRGKSTKIPGPKKSLRRVYWIDKE